MPPRTRAAAEAVGARRNVLTDTDLLSLVFEHLDAKSLCRAATVCKKWRATETNKHWRALLASRWPNSVELQDALLKQPGAPGIAGKIWFEDFVERGTKADFSFELEIRLVSAGPGQLGSDDGTVLLHQTFYGALAERQPQHTVNGVHGSANHGLEFECSPDSAEALTIVAQTYLRQVARSNGDDPPDAGTIPIDEVDAADVFYAGRENLQVRVTVWYASDACGAGYPEHVSVQRTFNMELDAEAELYTAIDENDEITIPSSEFSRNSNFSGLGVREVASRLTVRLVPEPTETGAEWKAVFDVFPNDPDTNFFHTTQMLKGIKDKLIANLYDESKI